MTGQRVAVLCACGRSHLLPPDETHLTLNNEGELVLEHLCDDDTDADPPQQSPVASVELGRSLFLAGATADDPAIDFITRGGPPIPGPEPARQSLGYRVARVIAAACRSMRRPHPRDLPPQTGTGHHHHETGRTT